MRSTSSGAGVRSVAHPDASCVTVLHMLSISNDSFSNDSSSNDSISNDSSSNDSPTIGDRILEAAAYCVVAYGVDRVTLAEIARRARVSRPTVYRRWPDTRAIVAALLTQRITGVMRDAPLLGDDRESLVRQIVSVANLLRRDELVMSVMHSELAPIYITERLGASQQMLIDALAERLRAAQRHGSART